MSQLYSTHMRINIHSERHSDVKSWKLMQPEVTKS
jgi:hypothetical protein